MFPLNAKGCISKIALFKFSVIYFSANGNSEIWQLSHMFIPIIKNGSFYERTTRYNRVYWKLFVFFRGGLKRRVLKSWLREHQNFFLIECTYSPLPAVEAPIPSTFFKKKILFWTKCVSNDVSCCTYKEKILTDFIFHGVYLKCDM